MIRWAARPAVATLLVVAAWVGLPTGPAHAAGCTSSSGVTVVVDFNELAGGVQGKCVRGGGTADVLFDKAGFELNANAPGNPGYVCQVNSQPGGCTPPDSKRYWGLWWSDGTGGTWTYSSLGAGGLSVPEGGYVAFSWDQVSGKEVPSYAPTPHRAPQTPPPSPTQQPSQAPQQNAPSAQPTRQPPRTPGTSPPSSSGGATATDEPSSTATPTGPPTPTRTPSATPTPSITPTPTDTGSPSPGATPSDAVTELADPVAPVSADANDDGGLPGWLAPLVIVLLFGLAGAVLLLKRRQGTTTP